MILIELQVPTNDVQYGGWGAPSARGVAGVADVLPLVCLPHLADAQAAVL